jgi:plasmid stabilization system protein ParE
MKHRVEVMPRAKRDLREAYQYIAAQAPLNATRWLSETRRKIRSLADLPQRCALAPEAEVLRYELRQLVTGNYRVLFVVEGNVVRVLHVRHAQRLPATVDELL